MLQLFRYLGSCVVLLHFLDRCDQILILDKTQTRFRLRSYHFQDIFYCVWINFVSIHFFWIFESWGFRAVFTNNIFLLLFTYEENLFRVANFFLNAEKSHFIEDASKTPHVYFGIIVILLKKKFWSSIPSCANVLREASFDRAFEAFLL